MSAIALERLKIDLQQDPVLLEDFQTLDGNITEWISWAGQLGYELTGEEAEGLTEIHGELSEEDLEMAAGGWPDPPPPTNPPPPPPPPPEGGG